MVLEKIEESVDVKDVPERLFKDVRFYIIGDIDDSVSELLKAGGAENVSYMSEHVSHVVADVDDDDVIQTKDVFQTPVVKSKWVLLSIKCKTLLPTKVFDPDTKFQIFTDCVLCCSQLTSHDSKVIWALVSCYGGKYRTKLNNKVTHLVTASKEGAKYSCAKKRGEEKIKIVTPDWVVKCVESLSRLDEARYHPDLLLSDENSGAEMDVKPASPFDFELESSKKEQQATKEAQARTSKQHATAAMRIKESFINEYDDSELIDEAPPPAPLIHSFPMPQQSTPTIPIIKIKAIPPPPLSTAGQVTTPTPSRSKKGSNKAAKQHAQTALSVGSQPGNVTGPQPSLAASTGPNYAAVPSAKFSLSAGATQAQSLASQPGVNPALHATSIGQIRSLMPQAGLVPPSSLMSLQGPQGPLMQSPGPQGGLMPMQGPQMGLFNTNMNKALRMTVAEGLESPKGTKGGGAKNSSPRSNTAKMNQMMALHQKQQQQLQQQQMPLPLNPARLMSPTPVRHGMATTPTGFPPAGSAPGAVGGGMKAPVMASPLPEAKSYYGHDPGEHIPDDICLLGCVFYITDYQKTLYSEKINIWKKVITQYGGQVDDSYSNRITHVLCEHQRSDVFQLALRDGKRLVTAFWLSDCLLAKKMFVPHTALHFPYIFGKDRPCANQIICMTNFSGEDRTRIKNMILQLGAQYTGYMTRANSVLVARRPGGRKYQKARDWQIPVVNVYWLSSILLGDLYALKIPLHSKYETYPEEPFNVDPAAVSHLLEGWRAPVKISKETWKKFQTSQLLKSPLSAQNSVIGGQSGDSPALSANRKHSAAEAGLSQSNAAKRRRLDFIPADEGSDMYVEGKPVVLITGVNRERSAALSEEVERLGGQISVSPRRCTHIVTTSIQRTVKFLTAFSVTRHVVTPEWIENSSRAGHFLDEEGFAVKDVDSETTFSFTLQESLRRAKQCKVFTGLSFYVTPSVLPSIGILSGIIESAGGRVVEALPLVSVIQKMVNHRGEPTLIIITCPEDLFMCQHLIGRNIGLHNVELVLTGVIRQSVDYKTFRIELKEI